jgi:hypothetical protein
MHMMIDNNGQLLCGELSGDNFIVQTGSVYDPRFDVYDVMELSPVGDELDYPLELDADYTPVPHGD